MFGRLLAALTLIVGIASLAPAVSSADPLSDVAGTTCTYEQIRDAAESYQPGAAAQMDNSAASTILRQILAVPPPIRRALLASSGASADFGDYGWAVSAAAQSCGSF
ncbi:MAG: hypothetical protein E6R04_06690 [Spirochaetes bacterium]|nr:MAG: hypothetical protein E6R04_06690 [Spirochaetota bacterium]